MAEQLGPAGAVTNSRGRTLHIMERIRKVFVDSTHWNVREEELSYERMLEEATALDSIAVLEFVTALESEFGISLEPELLAFDFLRDLSRLASYIEARVGSLPDGEAGE